MANGHDVENSAADFSIGLSSYYFVYRPTGMVTFQTGNSY